MSASEISHFIVIARHEVPRQSVGIRVGVYAANFTHGDRHANARDDTENLLSLRGSEATKQTPGRVAKNVILNDSEESHRTIDAMIYSFFLEQNAAKEIKNEGLSTFF